MSIDATEQARMVRDGEVSPSELLEEAIARVEQLNPHPVAAIGREDLLLRVASQVEQAEPWADRSAPLHATA